MAVDDTITLPAEPAEPEAPDAPRKERRQQLREVGRSLPRLESTSKVDGSVEYIHNLRLPGMLHGKIHRSAMAHAGITRINTAAALALDGVHAVITAEDVLTLVPEPYYGPAFHDQPILASSAGSNRIPTLRSPGDSVSRRRRRRGVRARPIVGKW